MNPVRYSRDLVLAMTQLRITDDLDALLGVLPGNIVEAVHKANDYDNLLEILADPKHPEHQDMKGWIGDELNAEEFSVEGVNLVFKRLKA